MTRRLALLGIVVALAVGLVTGCASPPPLLTQKQVDSGVLPKEHPKLTAEQAAACTGCHKVD